MSENLSSLPTSFSGSVKEELLLEIPSARHCKIAEIAAITAFCGLSHRNVENKYQLCTDSEGLVKKYFTLLSQTIKISEYANFIWGKEFAKLCELIKQNGEGLFAPVNDILLQQECCRQAFLRGAFLAAGSVTDPNKSYHLEIVSSDRALSYQVLDVFNTLGISAKVTERKNNYVIYIKEGTLLVDALGIMGAPLRLMDVENVRILKGIRNDLNRRVNCEAANIKKTIDAALAQIADIDFIDDTVGLSELNPSLQEVAILRRNYPEATLGELGGMLNPHVGKSGINHRLRRISSIAEKIRKEGKIK